MTTKDGILIRSRDEHNHPDHKAKLFRRTLHTVEEDLDEFIEIKSGDSRIDVVDTGTDFLIVHTSNS